MPDMWKGYVSANDEVRHTYEQVFYGRQLTDNNANNMPQPSTGPSVGGDIHGNDPNTPYGVSAEPTAPSGAGPTAQASTSDLYGSVYGPSGGTEATVWGHAAGDVQPYQGASASPSSGYPQLEPPTIDVTPTSQVSGPTATSGMTPG